MKKMCVQKLYWFYDYQAKHGLMIGYSSSAVPNLFGVYCEFPVSHHKGGVTYTEARKEIARQLRIIHTMKNVRRMSREELKRITSQGSVNA